MSSHRHIGKRKHSVCSTPRLIASKKLRMPENIDEFDDDTRIIGKATVPVTPQMIRGAVKELQTRRVYISSTLIGNHLRRSYPIENDTDALRLELEDKLNCAVCVGLIAKCGDDKYCMPTLRQQANVNKTAISAFWERYYDSGRAPNREKCNNLATPRTRRRRRKRTIVRQASSGSRNDDCQEHSLLDCVRLDDSDLSQI